MQSVRWLVLLRWDCNRSSIDNEAPTFHFEVLRGYAEVMNQQIDVLTSKLNQLQDGESADIFPMVNNCALDIICGEF